jgi:3-methyl-2-oxobutanoate hydroxymethyltransferase
MSAQSSPAQAVAPNSRKAITLPRLREMHAAGEKIAMLTAYDATFGAVADVCGVDCLLVGDSLGMVLQGHASTLPVTLQDMRYHVQCVARGNKTAWLIGDLPYGSYHESLEQAYRSACALMQAGAHMVKLEGGGWTTPVVEFLVARGIPVCAHLGLTPQTVHALGGYRVQGKNEEAALKLKHDAHALEDAGATMCVLEMVPAALAAELTAKLGGMATIGIGAGLACAGQVLVLHDMLGITPMKLPRFVRNFMQDGASVQDAIRSYVAAVKDGSFPDNAVHAY